MRRAFVRTRTLTALAVVVCAATVAVASGAHGSAVVEKSFSVSSNDPGGGKAPCASNQRPTGGGFALEDSQTMDIRSAFPKGKRFAVSVFNNDTTTHGGSAIAICGKAKGLSISSKTRKSKESQEDIQVSASCPKGTKSIGGGGSIAGEGLLVASAPLSDDGWFARYGLPGTKRTNVKAWAICDSDAKHIQTVQGTDVIEGRRRGNQGTGTATAECPVGTQVVSGGHAKVDAIPLGFGYHFSKPVGNGWQVSGYGHDGTLSAFAVCEKQ